MDTKTNNGDVTPPVQNGDVTTPKTFDELLKEGTYQSDFDKKIAQSLETARANWEKDQAEKQSEADKLAKMKENERKDYELEKARKEREEVEAKLNAYELKEQAIKIANTPDTKVDVSLLNLIDFKTIKAEQVEATIKNIKGVVDKAIEDGINERLKEKTPINIKSGTQSGERVSRFSV